jgi:membrane-bound metal-dependent hydrolase YbcI (DUF457 family)
MFVGHTAVALAAKSRAPRTSLGVFVAAAFAPDLLWPIFLFLGLEHVRIDPGNTAFTPLAFDSYPWSHSLLMTIVWGAVGAALVRLGRGDRQTQILVMLLVVSHWVLDVVSHRADMPLWPGRSLLLGLGLWNSVVATLAIEGAMLAIGLMLYLRSTKAADRVGSLAFWSFIGVMTFMWAGQPWSSPPHSPRDLAWFGLVGAWLLPTWAWWADRHRVALSKAPSRRHA